MRGYLPKYIAAYLNRRLFRVQLNNSQSREYEQENGVVQGGILSVSLFALKINSIVQQIPQDDNFHASLYVDDLQIGYHHSDLNRIETKLQTCINNVEMWATNNGFKFSVSKTKVVHFNIKPGLHLSPTLRMYKNVLPYVDTFKFLGLTFDSKLTWNCHIAQLKADCNKKLGLLRSVTAQEWGADQYCLLKIYRMLIRSKLDYGSIVYNSASQTTLKSLNPIANEALRIATGCFKSTPCETLHVLTNEKPLDLRRKELSLRYYYKIRGHPGNPAFNRVVNLNMLSLFRITKIPCPFALRIAKYKTDLQITGTPIQPAFSYSRLNITTPTWSLEKITVNRSMCIYPKIGTPDVCFTVLFSEIRKSRYVGFIEIYTDGSKSDEGVGSAAVCRETVRSQTLPTEASIYSAEAYAIHLALSIVRERSETKYVIMSDSSSVLYSMGNPTQNHPLIRKLQHDIAALRDERKLVELFWIPGHVGITGNESADQAAKRIARGEFTYTPIYYHDMYPVVSKAIRRSWNQQWRDSKQKMYEIRTTTGSWNSEGKLKRRDEVIINRLRSGHTLLTHGYLMDDCAERGSIL
jgi:ribonuclease HI